MDVLENILEHIAACQEQRDVLLKQRHDLKDQSQSGYDLALACFGVDAGLAEQQIVDLTVHHRSLFARPHRTRLDYFQRTIAKAGQRIGGSDAPLLAATHGQPAPAAPPTTGPTAPQGAPVGPEEAAATDTATPGKGADSAAKALLCERISGLLGIQIRRLVKIEGKEPQYRMELAGADTAQGAETADSRKIEFANVGKLISQDSVRVSTAIGKGAFLKKHDPYWDIPLNASLPQPVIDLPGLRDTDGTGKGFALSSPTGDPKRGRKR